MKRFSLILLGAVALVMNACEPHPLAGQAPLKEEHEGGHGAPHAEAHSAAPAATEHHDAAPAAAGEHSEAAAKPAAQLIPEKK